MKAKQRPYQTIETERVCHQHNNTKGNSRGYSLVQRIMNLEGRSEW